MSNETTSFTLRISKDTLEQLDKEAKLNGVSRTELICELAKLYCNVKQDFIYNILTSAVRSAVNKEIKRLVAVQTDFIRLFGQYYFKENKSTSAFIKQIIPEYEKIDLSNAEIDDILFMTEMLEKDKND